MSQAEAPFGLTIMEKLIGFFIMLIGIIIFYVTYANLSSVGSHPIIFLVAGLILMGLGIVMLIAKTE
ncbi:MAG: hypothetical protein ACETVM_00930 [Candidatus Bathyarchaeia archaeon]